MTELRAPDPTLDEIETDALLGLDYSEGEPLIAHTVRWVLDEGHVPDCAETVFGGLGTIQARYARWFAVPCRACFPDAPKPGHVWSRYVMGRVEPDVEPYLHKVPHLAWQVPS